MAQVVPDSSFDHPLMQTWLFYVAVLGLKMLVMSLLTGRQRFKNKAFINPEDAAANKVKVKSHDDVERVRRAHLNDLENIPVFFAVSYVYLTTNPSTFLAQNLIRIFTLARIMHTLVYAVVVVPQPARAIAWGAAYFITGYMAVASILHYL